MPLWKTCISKISIFIGVVREFFGCLGCLVFGYILFHLLGSPKKHLAQLLYIFVLHGKDKLNGSMPSLMPLSNSHCPIFLMSRQRLKETSGFFFIFIWNGKLNSKYARPSTIQDRCLLTFGSWTINVLLFI